MAWVPWWSWKKDQYGSKPRSRKKAAKRYEVRWAVLDPSRGAEMAKTRPVVIVSLDELNARLQTVTVCPITSHLHSAWRCRLPVRGEGRPAEGAGGQSRAAPKHPPG